MNKIIKFVVFLISLITFIFFYDITFGIVSNISDFNNVKLWFFSTVAQFNGAIVGLILAALGISFIIHSEKTIFLFKEKDFKLLKYTIYIFILNTFFGFMGLSVIYQPNYSIGLFSLTLLIEILALVSLGVFFARSIYIFQKEALYELNKRDIEKLINDFKIELEVSNDKETLLFLTNRSKPVFDVEGIIHPRISKRIKQGVFSPLSDILNFQAIRIPNISRVDTNSRVQLSSIPKEVYNKMEIEDNLDFNINLKFKKGIDDFYYIIIYIALRKVDEDNLTFVKEPYFQVGTEDLYNYLKDNLSHNPYALKFNFSR
ncbi:hypothetical protein HNV12_08220 [Methanococcoides sp. SA1]|nr:hypothetical protein [Methanococcoides sp. SA1]